MTDLNCTDTTILASPAAQVAEEGHNPHHFSLRWSQDAQGEPLIWRGALTIGCQTLTSFGQHEIRNAAIFLPDAGS